MSDQNKCLFPTAGQRFLRGLGRSIANVIFPYSLSDNWQGLAEGEALLERGYGLITIMNHFSSRDAPQVFALLLGTPTIMRRPIVAPVAYHQYSTFVQFWSDRMAIQMCPIVTAETVKRMGSSYRQGDGLAEYVAATIDCFDAGGVVLLAPQGGRQASLGEPTARPVGNLLALAKRGGADRIALMFIGLGIPGVRDYSKDHVGGANIAKTYEIRIGKTLPAEQVLDVAGGLKHIDAQVFDYLKQLVPAPYVGASPESHVETAGAV